MRISAEVMRPSGNACRDLVICSLIWDIGNMKDTELTLECAVHRIQLIVTSPGLVDIASVPTSQHRLVKHGQSRFQ